MIQLNDSKWKELEGGYRIPYDASIPLKKLEEATSTQEVDSAFSAVLGVPIKQHAVAGVSSTGHTNKIIIFCTNSYFKQRVGGRLRQEIQNAIKN